MYKEFAKRINEYSNDPSNYRKQKILTSVNGQLGAMRRNNRVNEAMALDELRKVLKRL